MSDSLTKGCLGALYVVNDSDSLVLMLTHLLSREVRSSSLCLNIKCFLYSGFIFIASSNWYGSISLRMVFSAMRDSLRI